MKGCATRDFWSCFAALPPEIRDRTRRAYALWLEQPNHSDLRFKRLNTSNPVYSVRVSRNYRALGVLEGDTVT